MPRKKEEVEQTSVCSGREQTEVCSTYYAGAVQVVTDDALKELKPATYSPNLFAT